MHMSMIALNTLSYAYLLVTQPDWESFGTKIVLLPYIFSVYHSTRTVMGHPVNLFYKMSLRTYIFPSKP